VKPMQLAFAPCERHNCSV